MASRILDIQRIAFGSYDRLLLAFSGAQFSIVSYRRDIRELTTVSLHSFANTATEDTLIVRPTIALGERRVISVEAEGRCAVLRIGEAHLAFLALGKSDGDKNCNRQSNVLSLSQIDNRLRNLIRVQFLPGYHETTLALLYEPTQTWPYRFPARKDTLSLLVMTVDLHGESPTFTQLASYEQLPSDARCLWIPSASFPGRGIFLSGANNLLHIDPGHPTVAGIALNSFASTTTKLPTLRKTGALRTTFAAAQFIESGDRVLIIADDGEPFYGQIHRDGGGRRVEVIPAHQIVLGLDRGTSVVAATRFNSDLIAIVPIIGDAVILAGIVGPTGYRPNLKMSMDEFEEDLYAERANPIIPVSPTGSFRSSLIIGKILCPGPISDFCVGGQPESGDLEILASTGGQDRGAILVFKQYLPLTSVTLFNVSNCRAVYPLGHELYLASTDASSMVFSKRESGVAQLPDCAAIEDTPTVFATRLSIGLIQITSNRVRLMTGDAVMVIADAPLSSSSPAVCGAVAGKSIVAVGHEDGTLTVYQVEPTTGEVLSLKLNDRVRGRLTSWDLYAVGVGIFLAVILEESGTLLISDLLRGSIVFCNCSFLALPVLLTDSNNDLEPWYQRNNDLVDIRVLMMNPGGNSIDVATNPPVIIKPKDTEQTKGNDGIEAPRMNDAINSNLTIVVSSKSSGLVLYQGTDNSTLVRIPMAQYGSTLCGLLGEGEIAPSLYKIRFNGVMSEEVVVAASISSGGAIVGKGRAWMIQVGTLGYPRVHPVRIPGRTISLAEDFILYEQGGSLMRLRPNENFLSDWEWPFMRIDLPGEGVRSVTYHSPSSTYALITCRPVLFNLPKDEYSPISDNGDMVVPADALVPLTRSYAIKLLSPRAWTVIDEFILGVDEWALSIAAATLDTKQTATGRQPFLVVGTSTNRGEDRPARGRILVFDVVAIVPEIDRPETDRRLKLLTATEAKGPVGTVGHLDGCLVASIGAKTIVHTFENNETLTGVAFVDAGVYATSLVSLKSFFAVGDLCKGVSLHAFQGKPPKIITLGRDGEDRAVVAVEVLVEGRNGATTIVSADNLGNLSLLSYEPTHVSSEGGMRLIPGGSIRLAEPIRRMRRVVTESRHGVLVGGQGGSIVGLVPIDEITFRRLEILQLRVAASLPHLAGLHPRTARQVHAPIEGRPQPIARTLLDITPVGLLRLLDLPRPARDYILSSTSMIGMGAASNTSLKGGVGGGGGIDASVNIMSTIYSVCQSLLGLGW